MSRLKLLFATLLLFVGSQTIAQTLIITETENGKNAAISMTQGEPGKMIVCLAKAPGHLLSCYEPTGGPLHLTDQNFTQYLAKKYEIDLAKANQSSSHPDAKMGKDSANEGPSQPNASRNQKIPASPTDGHTILEPS